jgi:hypothetical protein
MQKFTFVCKKHEEYGSLGWALKCKPHFEPLGGMTVAHDVMEHFPRDNGTLAAEWQAFGAMMRIRHEGNWWSNQGNTKYQEFGDQAYVDLFDHYRKVVYGELSVDEAPRTMKLEDDLEEQIQKMVANFRREIDREVDPDDQSCDVDFFCKNLVGWIRIGYRKACKRYSEVPAWKLSEMFSTIADKADKLLKDAYEGMEMVVEMEAFNGHVSVEAVEDEAYAY